MHIGTIRMMASGRLQLVLRGEHQDHEHHREGQHRRQQRQLDAAGQRDLAGQAVLQREVGPLKAHAARQAVEQALHLGLGLPAGEAGLGRAIDVGRGKPL